MKLLKKEKDIIFGSNNFDTKLKMIFIMNIIFNYIF